MAATVDLSRRLEGPPLPLLPEFEELGREEFGDGVSCSCTMLEVGSRKLVLTPGAGNVMLRLKS